MELIPTIGLEIHAQLKTATKMFCRSKNDPDEKRPNVNVCPVCLAHPGTLPTINKKAIEHVLRVGLALGGTLADYTEWDRKNYFYPDIPKGYQISQYQFPLVSGGELNGVKLTRIHLEEDTARNQHSENSEGESLVDFNRAGVPLMELVTEPVITSAKQAGDFARELQLVLRYLGVSEANMEKGEMRVEANVSLSSSRSVLDGVKVEVKNLNSFRAVERAIEFELNRQKAVLESGEKVVQETRGWDDAKQITFSQRKKESSHDYRYFPDPDLPKLKISEIAEFKNLPDTIPELPREKRERLRGLGFLQEQDVEQLVSNLELSQIFWELEQLFYDSNSLLKIGANFLLNDVVGQKRKDPNWSIPDAVYISTVVRRYADGTMSSPQAKQAIFTKQMMAALDNSYLPDLVKKIIANNPKVVGDYKSGKESALQFLVGQGMKESKGAANPEKLKEFLIHQIL